MSLNYEIAAPVADGEQTIMGKRLFCQVDMGLQQPVWTTHRCKRPRRIVTPGSVISAITQEEDTESTANRSPPLPYEACTGSPERNVVQYAPTSSDAPESYGVTESAIKVSDGEDEDDFEEGPDEDEEQPLPNELRSDEDIQADVDNSFAGGHCGTVSWTPELLIQVLANEVEDLIYSNEERVEDSDAGDFQVFYSSYKQPFELDFYMRRLVQYVNCSTSVFVTMFVYLDRIQSRCKALLASDMNCHRLVFTCMVLAVKYLEDEVHSNAYYSRVGGLTITEMNNLEIKLLDVLDWNLNVAPDTYAVYEEGLIQTAGLLIGDNGGYGSPVTE